MTREDDLTTMSSTDSARQFSTQERKQAAKKGQAKSDGGYPIKNRTDLENAVKAYGRSPSEATKRHIIKRARALGLTKLLPSKWGVDSAAKDKETGMKIKPKGDQFCLYDGAKEVSCHPDRPKAVLALRKLAGGDKAEVIGEHRTGCYDPDCEREFLTFQTMVEHAEAVHTFNDIERLVADAVRDKYYKRGDYRAEPPVPGTYVWVTDMANEWVVFSLEKENDTTLYKAAYTISDDSIVTLGAPVEVVRRTVYEEVTASNPSRASVSMPTSAAVPTTA